MKKILLIILKTIFALLLGIILSISLLQYQDNIRFMMAKNFKNNFEFAFDCQIDFKLGNLNLIFPSMELIDVKVKPLDNNLSWNWGCKKLIFKSSFLGYLISKKFNLDVKVKEIESFSELKKGKMAIIPHIKKLLIDPNIELPISLNKLHLNKAEFKIKDYDRNLDFDFIFSGESKEHDNLIVSSVYLLDGIITFQNKKYLSDLTGKLQLINSTVGKPTIFSADCLCSLPFLDEKNKCFIYGKWENEQGAFKVGTIDGKIEINNNLKRNENSFNFDLETKIPIIYIQKLLPFEVHQKVEGDCALNLKGDLNNLNETLNGTGTIKNLYLSLIPTYSIDELFFDLSLKDEFWFGNLSIEKANKFKLSGNWNWDNKTNKTQINLSNPFAEITYNDELIIKENNLKAKLIIDNKFNIQGDYNSLFYNKKTKESFGSLGRLKGSDQFIEIAGDFNKQKFELECQFQPMFCVNKFLYKGDEGKEHIKISSKSDSKNITASIYFNFIKDWLIEKFKYNLEGDGIINLEGEYTQNGFQGNISLINGDIRFKNVNNVIKNITGFIDININEKRIDIKDLVIKFNKGNITAQDGIFIFKDSLENLKLEYIHVPLIFNNCFINWKKDFISILSGRVLIAKDRDKKLSVSGNLMIDKTQIKHNIFSNELKEELINLSTSTANFLNSNDFLLNLSILSRSSLKIKTPFFESKADLNINIKNNLQSPEISGFINLKSGTIYFPYKSLYITEGFIQFIPGKIFDPVISLTAKAKVLFYKIKMEILGTLKNAQIIFETSPSLSNEQVSALLMVGSDDASLNLVMPAMLMEQVKKIFLESSQTNTKLYKSLKSFLKPFKTITFEPSYSDKLGISKDEGKISIEFDENLEKEVQLNS